MVMIPVTGWSGFNPTTAFFTAAAKPAARFSKLEADRTIKVCDKCVSMLPPR